MKKCIKTDSIIFWSLAGYAAYLAILYVYRKPACEYAQKICARVS